MSKNSFVLSWGRKMFFGLGWALTSVVALSYFQSMLFPTSTVGWLYLLTTFVGHYGMALTLIYFFIYSPVVLIFPSYYISRIWSITLILVFNAFVFFDSYVFVRYRFHLNSFLWDFLQDRNALSAFGFTPVKLGLLGFVSVGVLILLWVRGEALWRRMGRRFSNPVKNWYLGLILLCFILSNVMHMFIEAKENKAIDKLANLFPLHFPLTAKTLISGRGVVGKPVASLEQGYKDFYYPSEALNCPKQAPLNILMIVLDQWRPGEFSQELTPNLFHFGSHGEVFVNHLSGGLNPQDGYFSLLYSLPPTYEESVLNARQEPVFLSQLRKTEMDLLFYNSGAASPLARFLPKEKEIYTDYLVSQLAERVERADAPPFFMHVYLGSEGIADKDRIVNDIVSAFIKHKLVGNTIMMITGASSSELKTPLIVISPEGQRETIQKMTSHYDVLPTLMREEWRCKTSTDKFSFGQNLYAKNETEFHVAGNDQQLMIFDVKKEAMTSIKNGSEVNVTGADAVDITFTLDVLNKLTRFYKSR